MSAHIACIIATQGRETLKRAVRSVLSQDVRHEDQLIIVVDTRDLTETGRDMLRQVRAELETRFRMEECAVRPSCPSITWAYHKNDRCTFSHEQAAYGVSLAPEGHWISLLGDDDVYTPGAWAAMRASAEAGPPRPILFRMDHNGAGIIWREPALRQIREGCISEQNLIVPKLPGLIGTWDFNRYAGDFDWVESTLARWVGRGILPDWDDTIIQFSRPAERGYVDDLE